MPIEILMPALSPTMEEGNLAKWHVKVGDSVTSGDVICEIETDKATMEVEAIDEGTVGKILIEEGAQGVPVNTLIAVLLEDGESADDIGSGTASSDGAAPKAEPVAKEEAPAPVVAAKPAPVAAAPVAPTPVAAPAAKGTRVFASPLARRIAADKGLDLASITGSGPHGRIVKGDVESAKAGAGAPVAASAVPATSISGAEARAMYEDGTYEAVPNDGMRTVVANRLTAAKRDVPHFYVQMDCNIDALLTARSDINAAAPKDSDGKPAYKISVNDFIVKAWALALQQVPLANATWAEDSILYHKASDVAVAVAVPGGLFTPVVRSAETKSLRQISAEVRDYAARAKSKKLAPHEYQGGSSAVSNLGMFGVKNFTSILNPPHGTIIAIGAGEKRAIVVDDEIKIATIMTVSLTCDHRSVDGALGAVLLGAFKKMIEQPVMMLA